MHDKLKITKTKDGSPTIYLPEYDEHYHSFHGAVQESMHVFIENGMKKLSHLNKINIFEVGFGTGLNAFLTFLEHKSTIYYESIELFPLPIEVTAKLNYPEIIDSNLTEIFNKIHHVSWEESNMISDDFYLLKKKVSLQNYSNKEEFFDIIYYDAFGPRVQPEMWTIEIFEKMYQLLKKNAYFVTYCAKGQVKRDLKAVGFEVNTLPGPPGKREMIRCKKN